MLNLCTEIPCRNVVNAHGFREVAEVAAPAAPSGGKMDVNTALQEVTDTCPDRARDRYRREKQSVIQIESGVLALLARLFVF